MSGTVRAAEQARDQLGERAERVHVIDSATGCGGQGLVAARRRRRGCGGEDGAAVAARAKEARERLKMWFAVDTLEYLRRGGRIGSAQAWLGTALKIKPILTLESEITPFERVRTSRRAFERMVDLCVSRRDDGADGWVVQHIQAPREAERLAGAGREIFGTRAALVSEIGPVIGTHVGPGLLGRGLILVACWASGHAARLSTAQTSIVPAHGVIACDRGTREAGSPWGPDVGHARDRDGPIDLGVVVSISRGRFFLFFFVLALCRAASRADGRELGVEAPPAPRLVACGRTSTGFPSPRLTPPAGPPGPGPAGAAPAAPEHDPGDAGDASSEHEARDASADQQPAAGAGAAARASR